MLATSDGPAALAAIEEFGTAASLIDIAPDGAFRFLALNRHEQRLLGLSGDVCTGKSPLEVMDAAAARREIDGFQRCVGTAAPVEWEQDAGPRRLRRTLLPLLNQGRVVRVLATSYELPPADDSALARAEASPPSTAAALSGEALATDGRSGSAREHLLRAVFDAIPEVLYVKDPDGNFIMGNKAMEAWSGLTEEELLKVHTSEAPWLDAEERIDAARRDRATVAEGRVVREYALPSHRFGEQVQYYDIIKAPVRAADGAVVGVVGINLDVTDRMEAEAERRRSDTLLRTVFDALPQGIVVIDREDRILLANEEMMRRREVTADQFPVLLQSEIPGLTEEQVHDIITNNAHVLNTGERLEVPEQPMTTPDGELRYYRQIRVPLRDENGRITGLVAVSEDITGRRRAELELARREQDFQNLVEGSIQGIAIIRDFKILFGNQSLADVFGYDSPAEMEALESTLALIHPADQEVIAQRTADRMRGLRVPHHYEFGGIRKDGSRIQVETVASKIEWGGEPAILITFFDISERRRAEHMLREHEALLRNVIANAPVAVGALDADGVIQLSDGKGLERFGRAPGQTVGRSYYEVYAEFPDMVESVRRALSDGESVTQVRDMGNIVFESRLEPVKDAAGQVTGLVIVAVDITERALAVRELLESRELLRAVFEALPLWCFVKDSEGHYLLANRRMCGDLGISEEALVGHTAAESEAVPLRKHPEIHEHDLQVLNEGHVLDLPLVEYELPNGAVQLQHVIKVPLRDEAGAVHRLVGIAMDVTARLRAEQKSQETQELLRAVFEALPIWIFVKDAEGRYLLVNRHMCDELGKTEAELLNSEVAVPSHFPSDIENMIVEHDAAVLRSLQPIDLPEVDFQLPGRELRVHHLIKVPLFNESGATRGLVGMAMDITERKAAHEALRHALEEIESLKDRLQAENVYLRDEIKHTHNFEEIVGNSDSLQGVLHQITQVAPTGATVLLQGESGTGKELFARAVHNLSRRGERPLVKVNCAALPANMIEAELFGHERGAFTGAVARRAGRFELADGGTIFLDEVGELPLDLQAKLLRVLQEGEFERLGSSHTHKVDVRIIAATNRDLEKAVALGAFREDLYYRLAVFPIRIPPLRDRKGDIPMLARHFTERISIQLGKSIEEISGAALRAMTDYAWPGNVRELENVIERAVILSPGTTLVLGDLLKGTAAQEPEVTGLASIREKERSLIQRTLEECNWVIRGKNGAADRLHIAASTLRDRMQKYGIRRPS